VSSGDDQSYWAAENDWYQQAPVARLAKALAQYEVYRSIVHLPGEVAEFGTFKAVSLIRLATFREVLESAHARRIYGFDSFGPFPEAVGDAAEDDAVFIQRFTDEAGEGLSLDETAALLEQKGFTNFELVAGDITVTLAAFLAERPALRLALVHVDVDLKPVTAAVLRLCAQRLVPGGVMMLDDYAKVAGATDAVEEFLADEPRFELRRSPLSYQPSLLSVPA
jgi:hypothetical protein